MNIQMLAFDLDGTALAKNRLCTIETLKAMHRLDEKGILLLPITGRCLEGIPANLLQFNHALYAITSNGARCTDLQRKETVFSHLLPYERAAEILEICEKQPVWNSLHINDGCYDTKRTLQAIRKILYLGDFVEHPRIDRGSQYVRRHQCDLEKIQSFALSEGVLKRLQKRLSVFKDLNFPLTHAQYMEITDHRASKGNALRELCRLLNIDMRNVMAVGDNENDLSMLELVGYPVAMGNATDEVKRAAKFVTASNTKNGLAKVIETLIL